MVRKYSGLTQILGLLGCILVPLSFVNAYFPEMNQKMLYLLYLPCLLMPALACRILFEGDESKLGRFFFSVGDFLYRYTFQRFVEFVMSFVKDKDTTIFKDQEPPIN